MSSSSVPGPIVISRADIERFGALLAGADMVSDTFNGEIAVEDADGASDSPDNSDALRRMALFGKGLLTALEGSLTACGRDTITENEHAKFTEEVSAMKEEATAARKPDLLNFVKPYEDVVGRLTDALGNFEYSKDMWRDMSAGQRSMALLGTVLHTTMRETKGTIDAALDNPRGSTGQFSVTSGRSF
jgi:hypothetical protein